MLPDLRISGYMEYGGGEAGGSDPGEAGGAEGSEGRVSPEGPSGDAEGFSGRVGSEGTVGAMKGNWVRKGMVPTVMGTSMLGFTCIPDKHPNTWNTYSILMHLQSFRNVGGTAGIWRFDRLVIDPRPSRKSKVSVIRTFRQTFVFPQLAVYFTI